MRKRVHCVYLLFWPCVFHMLLLLLLCTVCTAYKRCFRHMQPLLLLPLLLLLFLFSILSVCRIHVILLLLLHFSLFIYFILNVYLFLFCTFVGSFNFFAIRIEIVVVVVAPFLVNVHTYTHTHTHMQRQPHDICMYVYYKLLDRKETVHGTLYSGAHVYKRCACRACKKSEKKTTKGGICRNFKIILHDKQINKQTNSNKTSKKSKPSIQFHCLSKSIHSVVCSDQTFSRLATVDIDSSTS